MVNRVNLTRYFPDISPIEEKVSEVRNSFRQKTSLFILNVMSLARHAMNKKDIENYFYDTTGIFLSRLQTGECRRDENGKIKMIRLENPSTRQQQVFAGDEARILREAIQVYAPYAIIEEK